MIQLYLGAVATGINELFCAHRKHLYEILNSLPSRLAILVEIGRLPLSISEIAFWLTSRRAANSAWVKLSLPRKAALKFFGPISEFLGRNAPYLCS